MSRKQYIHIIFIIWLILFMILSIPLFAQSNVSIEDINAHFNGSQIEVSYNIKNAGALDQFTISMTAQNDNGDILLCHSINGDIGLDVIGGGLKKMIWDARKDGYVFNENIYFTIQAKQKVKISSTRHMLYSAILPGWGDYRIYNGKGYFLYSLAAYGSIATSIYLNNAAYQNRKNYEQSMLIDQRNNYYKKSRNQETWSYILLGTAATVWTYDLVRVAVKASQLKKEITPSASQYYYELSQKPIYGRSKAIYIDSQIPFDIAMSEGNELQKQQKFQEARIKFLLAKSLSPNDVTPNLKIEEIDIILADLKVKDEKYQIAISKADSLFASSSYDKAKSEYEVALNFKPNEDYPKKKINDINTILEQIRINIQYNQLIAEADNAMQTSNWSKAINSYNSASVLKPSELYPKNRMNEAVANKNNADYNIAMNNGNLAFNTGNYISAKSYYESALSIKPNQYEPQQNIFKINQILAQQKQDEINRAYKENIDKADRLFSNKEYSSAKTYYQAASALKSSEQYPKSQIIKIDNLLTNQIEATASDLPTLFQTCKTAVFYLLTKDYSGISQGSGFFLTSSGVAISNYHVFGTYWTDALILTEDGSKYEIEKVLAEDEDLDYIIFKVKNPNKKNFPKVKLAKTLPKIGEGVFAIGNPEGLEMTLSTGIISGIRGENNEYLQTTAPITHGSSGGPIFNYKGEVIGITSSGHDEGSLYFCLSILKVSYSNFLQY